MQASWLDFESAQPTVRYQGRAIRWTVTKARRLYLRTAGGGIIAIPPHELVAQSGRTRVQARIWADVRRTATRRLCCQLAVYAWLLLQSGVAALVVTLALFDRTTPGGISATWLASFTIAFLAACLWWWRPTLRGGHLVTTQYELRSLLGFTGPIIGIGIAFVALVYGSEDFHNNAYHVLYYRRLLTDGTWPVSLFSAAFVAGILLTLLRAFLARLGSGSGIRPAAALTLKTPRLLILAGVGAFSLLLSTASLMMINVNFWRYWATADGWVSLHRYPATMTDIVHVTQGGVVPYFISFPLLPAALVASYQLLGHNTFASYLPIVLANAFLPIGVFLTLNQITRNRSIALLLSLVLSAFPLLRNYTMDVGESDGILMTTVVFAAYLRARANDTESGVGSEVLAGVSAALAAFARPEGILYVAPMYLATLFLRWRSARFWISALALSVVALGMALVWERELGVIWPGNHSGTIGIGHVLKTLEVASGSRIFSAYSQALGLSDTALAAVVVVLSVTLAISTFWMLRRDSQLIYMPTVAMANVVMVFFVGPIPAEAAKFHDFFRHISYGFPLIAVSLGYALSRVTNTFSGILGTAARLGIYGGLALIVLLELTLLEGPVRAGNPSDSPIMTADVHVSATELLAKPHELPLIDFRNDGSRYIPDMPSYMAIYPDYLYQFYGDSDVRRAGNTAEYYSSARSLALATLALLAVSEALWARSRDLSR